MNNEEMSGLDQAFHTVETVGEEIVPKEETPVKKVETQDQVQDDYEYARGNLYQLVDKGQEAVNGALDLAMSSDHPRAYEVAGQLIKHVGDVADKLMALQKDKKAVKEESAKKVVTNNSLFVGSTADLQKMLKDASKKNDK
jgi:GTP cyclohydrolase II